MKRILFVMRARFGDMLMATPALRAIKQCYPQAELTVVADNKRGTILQGLPYIDRLVLLPKVFWPLMSWFGIRYFDYGVVCIAAHDKSAQKLGRRWAKVVAAEDQGYIQADHIIPPRADGEHLVKDAFRFAKPLQAEPAGWKIDYVPSQEETLNAQNWLSEAFGRSDGELIGLQLASFPTKSYRDWPQEHYLQLIEALLAQDVGRRIVLLGSDESLSRAEWLLEMCPKQVVSAVKRFNFRDNAALIGQLDLYMGPDTGPTHVAGALGRPMVVLYHPHHPDRILKPLEHPALTTLMPPMSAGGEAHMGDVSVQSVHAACETLLRGLS